MKAHRVQYAVPALTGAAVLGGLYLTSLYSYLLFHSLVEAVTIAVSWAVFFLAWNSRRFLDNHYLLFVGISSLFVGLVDLLHTLAFKGMGVLPGYDANAATQLWIAGRYLSSVSLLLAPLFLRRKLDVRWVCAIFGLVVAVLFTSVFVWRNFPACYVEGQGLTPFKIGSEYVIIAILLAALGGLAINRQQFDESVLRRLGTAIGLTILAEFVFTLYISVYDVSNLAGHLIRLTAVYFFYRAIIVTGLVNPYDLLFRDLRHHEDELSKAKGRLEAGNAQLQVEIAERMAEIHARERAEEALRVSEQRVRRKLESVLSPGGDLADLELGDIMDAQAIQSLMDDFYPLTRIPMAVIDLQAKVLVGVGWQDICTQFHRLHPTTCQHCVESDTQLSAGVQPGEFRLYKCKNNMWDVATPIMLGGRQMGNVFSGQFFFEDEPVDRGLFRAQARQYGFDEDAYLGALERVPRLSRQSVDAGMGFLIKLADLISRLSYSNLKLARSVAERDGLMKSLQASQERLQKLNRDLERQSGELQVANTHLEEQAEELQVANTNMEHVLAQEQAARAEAEAGRRMLEQVQPRIEKLNQDLERRNTALEMANQELEAFSYSVSHDLRAPLALINNLAQVMEQDLAHELAPQGQRYLSLMHDNANAMSRLIDDLLSFSRTTRQPLHRQTVEMRDLVHDVLAKLEAIRCGRQIEIETGPLPDARADPQLLRQVWVNLLTNAYKFTRRREVAQIEIGYSTQDGTGVYFVKDNGVGFDMEQADRLFGVFQRLHGEEEYEGTGVGLAIVERIVRRHGGRVWAEAEPDRGATFYFSLG